MSKGTLGNRSRIITAILFGALVAGCHNSDDDGGDGGNGARKPLVGAYHAMSDLGPATFLREEEVWSSIDFGDSIGYRAVDVDQYDFNFDTLLPGDDTTQCEGDVDKDDVKDEDECTRLATVSLNAVSNHEYTVVLFGSFAAPEVLVYDTTPTVFDDEGEELEVHFFHFAQSLGEIDVYLEPPGANLSPVQARATLSLKEDFFGRVDEGEYVLILTAPADPSTIYFVSEAFELDERRRVAFAIRDSASAGPSLVQVDRFGDQGGTLLDRELGAELRVVHAASGAENVDVYLDGDFAAPRFANLALGQESPYVSFLQNELLDIAVDFTPAGSPVTFLTREEVDLVRGERSSFLLIGAAGALDGVKSRDDARRLATHAQLRLVNGASTTIDFYVVKPSSNIRTLSPTTSLAFRSSGGWLQLAPGPYEIVLTRSGTKTVMYGPTSVQLSAGGVYSVVAIGTAETTAADVVLLDDF